MAIPLGLPIPATQPAQVCSWGSGSITGGHRDLALPLAGWIGVTAVLERGDQAGLQSSFVGLAVLALQSEQALLHARAITEWIRAALASRR